MTLTLSWTSSAAASASIPDLSEEHRHVFLADMGLEEASLSQLIRASYDLLGLQTYFTAGPKEVHAWTIHKGETASQAAGDPHRYCAGRGLGVRGAGWLCHALPLQCLNPAAALRQHAAAHHEY